MASYKVTLTLLRLLVLVGTAIIVALGTWCEYSYKHNGEHYTDGSPALIIITAINDRGSIVLSSFTMKLEPEAGSWSQFIAAAAEGPARTWVLVINVSTVPSTRDRADWYRVRLLCSLSS